MTVTLPASPARRRQDVQTDRAQVTSRGMKRRQDLLGNHRPEFPGGRKEAGELGLVERVVTAQQDHHRAGDLRRARLGLRVKAM
jgi:hypothetical protein